MPRSLALATASMLSSPEGLLTLLVHGKLKVAGRVRIVCTLAHAIH